MKSFVGAGCLPALTLLLHLFIPPVLVGAMLLRLITGRRLAVHNLAALWDLTRRAGHTIMMRKLSTTVTKQRSFR